MLRRARLVLLNAPALALPGRQLGQRVWRAVRNGATCAAVALTLVVAWGRAAPRVRP